MDNGGRSSAQANASGIGFLGALTLAFIVLKLCEVITWSWIWVLAPVWMLAALFAAVLPVLFFIVWWADACDRRTAARQRELAVRRQHRRPTATEHGPRQRWGPRPVPVYGNCPRHDTVHEMLKYGRMCDGWEPADPVPPDLTT